MGAILCGGKGRRMGSSKTNLILPTGLTMLESVASALGPVCTSVVTVGGDTPGYESVQDLRQEMGPLAGIEALLASGLDEEYLICPVDMPMITSDLLTLLLIPTTAPASIFDLGDGHKTLTLPLRISVSALGPISAALDDGNAAIHNVLARIDTQRVPVPREKVPALVNLNTPEDISSLY